MTFRSRKLALLIGCFAGVSDMWHWGISMPQCLLSSIHHIPDRVDLFDGLYERLGPGGAVLAMEEAHYLLRLCQLVKKCSSPGYLDARLRAAARYELATHHMCRLWKYRLICRKTGRFAVHSAEFWGQPRKVLHGLGFLEKFGLRLEFARRWTSAEMVMCLPG